MSLEQVCTFAHNTDRDAVVLTLTTVARPWVQMLAVPSDALCAVQAGKWLKLTNRANIKKANDSQGTL